jgi:dTDP-4-dehydrorhamnose 3,5-epimerase
VGVVVKVQELKLPGVYRIEPKVHTDARGFFIESYNYRTLLELGIHCTFIQDNQSLSIDKGTIRGLHYQLNPKAQTKLVSVIAGAIYDVVVDIRRTSPTYGQWVGEVLSAENYRQLLISPGFAHGFCTLQPQTKVMYKVDDYYSPEHERGILWDDPSLDIDWPTNQPIVSDKDLTLPRFIDAELSFE